MSQAGPLAAPAAAGQWGTPPQSQTLMQSQSQALMQSQSPRVATAWAVLATVPDPEVPALSVFDLGIVREVIDHPAAVDGSGPAAGLEIVLTPTYSGCPATEVIAADCLAALAAAGLGAARITMRRAPAWTTDWISEAGRRKLREYGIAPPGPVNPLQAGVPMRIVRRQPAVAVACPRCESWHTERLSAFGATACKALYRCLDCREPFEHFKPI